MHHSRRGMTLPLLLVGILVVALAGVAVFKISSRESIAPADTTPEGAIGEAMEEKNMLEERDQEINKGMSEGDGAMEQKDSTMQKSENEMMQKEPQKEADAMQKPGPQSSSYQGTALAGSQSPLLDFNKADYDKALTSGKLVVLYFYASWCPICKAEVANALYPAFNELENSNIIGFRVNYNDSDTDKNEEALARQFGVGYQHTKVFLKNGERVLKAPDSWSKARYLSEIAAHS